MMKANRMGLAKRSCRLTYGGQSGIDGVAWASLPTQQAPKFKTVVIVSAEPFSAAYGMWST
jgi:hypothetical protein